MTNQQAADLVGDVLAEKGPDLLFAFVAAGAHSIAAADAETADYWNDVARVANDASQQVNDLDTDDDDGDVYELPLDDVDGDLVDLDGYEWEI